MKGTGAQRPWATRDLPLCIGQWVATGFVFGLVLAPRATRMVAGTFSALTAAEKAE